MATASTSSMSGSTPPSAHDSARHAFNIKVLRRHDASISSILYSASFVVLYQYSTSSSSWTKTGIEGPMFLYKRSESPFYGAFVLNRNGVENWASSIRGEDDLEVSEDFVIFRSTSGEQGDDDDEEDEDGDGDRDRVIGIWVFEKEQRVAMGEEMIRLQTLAEQEDGQEPAETISQQQQQQQQQAQMQPQPQSQSISLDALFASASSSSSSNSASSQLPAAAASAPIPPAPLQSQAQPSQPPGSGPSLLDAIFQSQSQSQSEPQTKQQQEEKSAQPAAAPPPAPSAPPAVVEEKSASPRDEAKNKKNDSAAAGLMAMLGLGGGAGAGKKEDEEEKKSKEQQATQSSAPPAPAPAAASKTGPKAKSKSHTSTNGTATASFPQTASSVLLDAHEAHRSHVSQETAPGSERTTPAMMSKGDFVREILQLIHTDKDFVAGLYDAYVERVKR